MNNSSLELVEYLANQFRWFAKVKSHNSSPFYESLSLKIAEDKELHGGAGARRDARRRSDPDPSAAGVSS